MPAQQTQQLPRLAVIGCGAIAYFALIPALLRMRWAPSVLVDTNPKRLKLVAKRMGGKGANVVQVSDWQSVADGFDAAIVAVPHIFHGPIGRALLAAGKHAPSWKSRSRSPRGNARRCRLLPMPKG